MSDALARVEDDGSPAQRNTISNTLLGAILLTQPFETLVLQALPATLFMVVANPSGDPLGWLTLFLAVSFVYASIGALNDYCDFDLDRTAKPLKPLVRGLATPRFALWLTVIFGVIGLWLSIELNWITAGFSALTLALGYWYDFRAKRSLLSWVPFAIAIPSLPLWGFAAAGKFQRELLLAYPLGALLSVGLNMSNTLPDREADAAFGLRALTHRLTQSQAVLLTWALFAGAIAGFAAFAPVLRNEWKILGPGLAVGAFILAVMMADYGVARSTRSLRRCFKMSGILAIVVGLSWVASLPRT